MATTFDTAERVLFTSESVTEGHPDKICDQISDAVLDAALAEDPNSRVACETSTTTGMVLVFGEITTDTYIDIQSLVRDVLTEIGYTDSSHGFDANTCAVIVALKEQSAEISAGVTTALERRSGADGSEEDMTGAGDQGMMIGYACRETPELMPLPIALAHKVARRLAAVRKSGELDYLLPDGKSQVTVEYAFGKPVRVDTVVVSTQHKRHVANEQIDRDVINQVIREVVPPDLLDDRTKYLINPSGRFEIGGPVADAGLTGRKIIVDTYGGMARHGGGAFSGKDATKVDRSAAYAARYVAKNVVAAGLADRFEIQISYAIGQAHPVSIMCESFGTGRVGDAEIERLVRDNFDLRPGAIISHLDLRRPIYRQTAAYGHFGRIDLDLPWEQTDKAEAISAEAGLAQAAPAD
ncbi:MAG: methionine adenosyltransferase [Chloroflexota bacterium]|jgi:S-adenosylmethionine synthetase|nr:methionine adenosyltransferase [Chloroflexota bacterium]